ncbi:MFS transporter [Nocardia carnea]|uniref:MFS transporter n=1 Tax=Nocardia carnea TaxID=37328 RepID=UPI002455E63B|nr:MFS transporter [Nocardia carnea]
MFLTVFFAMLDLSVVNVALPTIREELTVAYSGMQWIANSYTLAFAGALLAGGAIVDRLGCRRAFLLSLAIFTLGALLCTVSGDLALLIIGRAWQGIGAAVLVPCSLTMIVDLFPDARQRAKAIGAWSAINAVALALGPVLGGTLLGWLGWRSVFGINVPAGILAAAVAVGWMVADHSRKQQQMADPAGIALALCASVSAAFAIVEAPDQGGRSISVIVAASVGIVSAVLFVFRNRKAQRPVIPRYLLQDGVFRASLVTVLCVGFSFSSALFLLAIQFQQARNLSPVAAGLALAPAAVAMASASTFLSRIQARIGAPAVVRLGLLSGAAGLVAIALTPPTVAYLVLVIPLALFGVGMGIALPAANNAALSRVSSATSGAGSAAIEACQQLGLVMGVAILGALQSIAMDRKPDFALLTGGLTALILGIKLHLSRRTHRRALSMGPVSRRSRARARSAHGHQGKSRDCSTWPSSAKMPSAMTESVRRGRVIDQRSVK